MLDLLGAYVIIVSADDNGTYVIIVSADNNVILSQQYNELTIVTFTHHKPRIAVANSDFTIVTFTHHKPRIAVAILDL